MFYKAFSDCWGIWEYKMAIKKFMFWFGAGMHMCRGLKGKPHVVFFLFIIFFIIFIEYALLKQVKIAQIKWEGNVAELKNRLKSILAECSTRIDLSRNMLYRKIIYAHNELIHIDNCSAQINLTQLIDLHVYLQYIAYKFFL